MPPPLFPNGEASRIMNCPHCGQSLDLKVCPYCQGLNLPDSLYCCRCGQELERELEPPPDLADRILCPDGACIGILDTTGRCSVCGYAYREVIASEAGDG